jgi:uncharacterized protein
MIADACLKAGAGEELASDPRGFLERHGLDPGDVDAILAANRLPLYRRLVRNGVAGVVNNILARTRARLNGARAGAFDESVASFLDEAAPRTHYLRDVPAEFLAWAAPRWRARADLPAWAADLAAFELLEFRVASLPPRPEPPTLVEVALDRPLSFSEAAEIGRFAFAVHEVPRDEAGASEPAERATSLLAYRDEAHAVRMLELTPLAAAILERLLAGGALGEAIAGGCAALGAPLTDAVKSDVARLLADLGERGVLLGGLTPPRRPDP